MFVIKSYQSQILIYSIYKKKDILSRIKAIVKKIDIFKKKLYKKYKNNIIYI